MLANPHERWVCTRLFPEYTMPALLCIYTVSSSNYGVRKKLENHSTAIYFVKDLTMYQHQPFYTTNHFYESRDSKYQKYY